MSRVNAGCGSHYVPGWTNVDTDRGHTADVYADLSDRLPFRDGSVDRIFASHVLEHLDYFGGLPDVLAEFRRMLAPDGELCVICPDIERAVILGEPSARLRAVVAWPTEFNVGQWAAMTPPTGHAWTATGQFVEHALTTGGFKPTSYTGRLADLATEGWPLENFGDWQTGYVCRKEC